jgi:tRNA(Ile2) C34 agmatinyltransferase TiaS
MMKKLLPLLLIVAVSGVAHAEESTETAPKIAADAPVFQAQDTAGLQAKAGTDVVVEGIVQNVGKSPNEGITFINFGDRRTGFVAVVFRPAYDKFPDGFEKYAQQKVRVKGRVENYRDRQLQIKIFTPDQLEIISSAD